MNTAPKPTNDAAASRQRLLEIIREKSYITEGDFALASGASSNFFFDLKTTLLDPEGASLTADAILDLLMAEQVEAVGGLELGACPIASAVCVRSFERNRPLRAFYVRKSPKSRGTQKRIEGEALNPGERVAVVEDVTTSGGSLLEAVKVVKEAGCVVVRAISIVDREQGARAAFEAQGVAFTPLFTRADFE